MRLKLLSWNVAGRTKLLPEQVAAVSRREADLVCLQEVRASTVGPWRRALARDGLEAALDSSEFASKRLFNLTASRWRLTGLPAVGAPQPERALSALSDSPAGLVEIHNVHVPPAQSNGLVKVETCEALIERLSRPADRHRILCGDFNTPRLETEHGEVETFAANHPGLEERWDAAERGLLVGLADWDLNDAFRALNGYDRRDDVLASASLRPVHCDYVHGWREGGLSDHSAIEAVFEPAPD
jgi:exonuclease III